MLTGLCVVFLGEGQKKLVRPEDLPETKPHPVDLLIGDE